MQGIRLADLQSVVSFMYQGEVYIDRQQLSSFLAVAEDLQVKGRHTFSSNVADPHVKAEHRFNYI